MKYLDQAPNDLNLCVADTDVDETQFTILQSAQINLTKMDIKASIIGESHCIQFLIGSQSFVEVLACVPRIQCQSYVQYSLLETVGCNFDPHILQASRDLDYKIDVDVATGYSAKRNQRELLRQMKAGVGVFLIHEFPTNKDSHFIPTTAIKINTVSKVLEPNRFSWKTLHSYPNYNCVVTTQSSILLK